MAKTQRKKKSKQEELSRELQTRIIYSICLFLVIVATMKLGFVGETLHYMVAYLFGNLYGIIYMVLLCLFGYIIFTAKLPRFTSSKAVGSYLLFIGIILFVSATKKPVGLDVVSSYIKDAPLNHGGFIGAMIYAIFSTLFAYTGSIIAGVFFTCFGIIFIGGNFYARHKKQINKMTQKKIDKTKESMKKAKFIDFFSSDDDDVLFDEKVFEDKSKDTKEVEVVEEIEEEVPESVFEFNEHIQQIEIVDNNEIKPVEEKKEEIIEEKHEELIKDEKPNTNYQLPPLSLLNHISNKKGGDNKNHAVDNAERLTNVLNEFGVHATVQNISIGPSITKYELKLETGTRVNKIMSLQDDIKLALAAKDIRIEAPIPGKSAVGIEIPNLVSSMVSFKEVFQNIPKEYKHSPLLVPLGKDVNGKVVYCELNKTPHMLIAGATGSGKSVCVNTIICSILMRSKPDEVKLILVDPKKVELSNYNGIPHLLAPVVTDPKKAAGTLREVVSEMERRYDLFTNANVKKIEAFNKWIDEKNKELDDENKMKHLPYIVVILDEVADLMMVASKDVEDCIMRIAQLARAAGIHLIVATQRPSTDIITGVIKANIPSRIAFAVSSSIDSRTILDCTGAEKLLGKGDMLFLPMGSNSPTRVQGAYVDDNEVESITYFTTSQQEAKYEEKYTNAKPVSQAGSSNDDEDEEYMMCRNFVIQQQKASTSLLQRQFRIGYNKAARIIDQLEADGIIGPQLGSKPREVYVRGLLDSDE